MPVYNYEDSESSNWECYFCFYSIQLDMHAEFIMFRMKSAQRETGAIFTDVHGPTLFHAIQTINICIYRL